MGTWTIYNYNVALHYDNNNNISITVYILQGPLSTTEKASDELWYYKETISRAGSLSGSRAGSSVSSRGSLCR